ncbi:MAG TPA: fibronectin type III domain-containing protein [Archangium sp.]|uniref:fibronectin type III domain-containing protein n=1 Tax=Archangium sp. TaxID=1872627 RepID=UPI002E34F4E4|nr:fibronectin type III domain-containing protein [Archangium sp.]HEX5752797.1 fibronectin type III domain-containing protein [Archangium sp.]
MSWTTDEPASSQVEYGTTSALGSATAVDPARTTSHGMSLTGLQANRTYFYRVRSVDASGNAGGSQVLLPRGRPPLLARWLRKARASSVKALPSSST